MCVLRCNGAPQNPSTNPLPSVLRCERHTGITAVSHERYVTHDKAVSEALKAASKIVATDPTQPALCCAYHVQSHDQFPTDKKLNCSLSSKTGYAWAEWNLWASIGLLSLLFCQWRGSFLSGWPLRNFFFNSESHCRVLAICKYVITVHETLNVVASKPASSNAAYVHKAPHLS